LFARVLGSKDANKIIMKANHQFKAAANNIEMKLKELDERR